MGCGGMLLVLNALAWGGLTLMGMQAMAEQHARGYFISAQSEYYLYFPLAILCSTLAVALTVLITRRADRVRPIVGGATVVFAMIGIFLLPCYLIFYTGGI
jgi:hypothetical protein